MYTYSSACLESFDLINKRHHHQYDLLKIILINGICNYIFAHHPSRVSMLFCEKRLLRRLIREGADVGALTFGAVLAWLQPYFLIVRRGNGAIRHYLSAARCL